MIHSTDDRGVFHVDGGAESAVFKEVPDFWSKRTELARQFQVCGYELGIITDNLIWSLRVFDGILSLKQLLHRDNIKCLILELLDIFVARFARKRIGTELEAHHVERLDFLGKCFLSCQQWR